MGRAAGTGLAASGPGRRPVPRDDLQLFGVLVRARPALAARMDGQGARLRRDAGRAPQDRHGRRLLRPRLARRQDHRPGVDGRPADPLGRRAARIARPIGGRARALVRAGTAPRTRRSFRTPKRSTPSWRCSSSATHASAECTAGSWVRRTRRHGRRCAHACTDRRRSGAVPARRRARRLSPAAALHPSSCTSRDGR